jgi:peptide/nickel transport system permease protein
MLTLAGLVAALGSIFAPHAPATQFAGFVHAPPMWPRIVDQSGRLRAPFVYPLRLEHRLTREYSLDLSRPIPLRLLAGDSLLDVDPAFQTPWFPLGTDGLGRDVLSRLVLGARLSLGVAFVAVAGAIIIGALAGAIAASAGGLVDDVLMRTSEVIIALPALYVVLALRASLPLVLTAGQIFWSMAAVFAKIGWPVVARVVRAIIAVEQTREYAEAARAAGAGRARLLLRHLLPATRGQLAVQATLLLPGFILAEATLSFVGLGFAEPSPSWGIMLQEAGRGRVLAEAPWLLAPAAAITLVVLGINLVAAGRPIGWPNSTDRS